MKTIILHYFWLLKIIKPCFLSFDRKVQTSSDLWLICFHTDVILLPELCLMPHILQSCSTLVKEISGFPGSAWSPRFFCFWWFFRAFLVVSSFMHMHSYISANPSRHGKTFCSFLESSLWAPVQWYLAIWTPKFSILSTSTQNDDQVLWEALIPLLPALLQCVHCSRSNMGQSKYSPYLLLFSRGAQNCIAWGLKAISQLPM